MGPDRVETLAGSRFWLGFRLRRFVRTDFRDYEITSVFGAMGEILGVVRRLRLLAAQNDGDVRLCSPHGDDQRADAHDGHDALEIVGQHVQGHFGPDVFQRLHLEVGVAHP